MRKEAANDINSDPARTVSPAPSSETSLPISVVIPARNSASQLAQCLDALIKNRLNGVEIVVVDDASTDHTCEVVERSKYRDAAPLTCVKLEQRSGPAAARNEGMRAATSRHVLFLDSDILLPERAIESLRETLARYADCDEIAGVMGIYSEKIPYADLWSNFKNLQVCFFHQTTETVSPYLHTPILCIEKQVLEEEGGFDTSLATAEDFQMGLRLGSKGYRFVIDRSVQGTHLKRYSLGSLLKEDWRRVRDLLRIQMEAGQQKFLYRAHRLSRLLSAALPLPTLAAAAVSVWHPAAAAITLAFCIAFCLCNLSFLGYLRKQRGLCFSVKSAGLLFLEMLCAQIALAYWIVRHLLSFLSNHHATIK